MPQRITMNTTTPLVWEARLTRVTLRVTTANYMDALRTNGAWWTGQHNTDPRYLSTQHYIGVVTQSTDSRRQSS